MRQERCVVRSGGHISSQINPIRYAVQFGPFMSFLRVVSKCSWALVIGNRLLQQALHSLTACFADQKVTLRIGEPVVTMGRTGREFCRACKIGSLDE